MLPQCLPTFFYRSTTGNTSKCWILLGSFTQVLVCLVFKHHVVSAVDPICPFSLCCRRMLPNYGWLIFGTLPKLLLARVLVRCGKTWVLPNSILELGGLWSVDSKDTRFKHKPFQWRCVAKKCQTLPKNYLFYCNAPLSPWPNKALPRQERLYSTVGTFGDCNVFFHS